MSRQLINDFNNATNNDDRAQVLIDFITTYRRNIAPGASAMSNCLFLNPAITQTDREYILNKVRRGVVAALQYDFPNIDDKNLTFDFSKIEDLSNNFDVAYLTSKKWQSQPVLFDENILAGLNMAPKVPINFAGRAATIGYTDKSNVTVSTVHNNEYVSNSTQFYIDHTRNHLFSTVTTLTFTPVDASYTAANPAHLSATTLLDDKNFTRQLDICTYVLPGGDPTRAINILRYDGTGFDHINQVFYSPKHRNIIGDRAEVPHFHFPNHIEALLYTKKQSSDPTDKQYTTAGCNAISCTKLQQYLQYLDGLTPEQLEKEDSYNMPFVETKQKGIVFSIDLKEVLTTYINAANHAQLSISTMRYVEDIFREIQCIQNPLTGGITNLPPSAPEPTPNGGGPLGGGPLISNPTIDVPDKVAKTPISPTSNFKDLLVALEILKLVHQKQSTEENAVLKAEIIALESVIAKTIIESMSVVYGKDVHPSLKKNKETKGV